MNIVELVNAGKVRVHVSCMNKMLAPGESFSISQSELERNHELLTCISKKILSVRENQAKAEEVAEEVPEKAAEIAPADETGEEKVESQDDDPETVDIEEVLGVKISDADKEGSPDGKAYLKFGDGVVQANPMTAQVGKDEPSEGDEEEDGKRYVDGIEILDTTKNEKTVNVDGIDMVVDNTDEKDEYGPQFIEVE